MAVNFNGTTQYLSAGSAPVSIVPMTIAGWMRRTSGLGTGLNTVLASVGVLNGTDRNQVQFPGDNNGQGQALAVRAGSTFTALSTAAYELNAWTHLCGVFSAIDSRTVYVNGGNSSTSTVSYGSTQQAADSLLIGARSNGGSIGNYMAGDIADVGVWNVALNAAEIASLAKGVACRLIRPQSLVFYAPLVRDLLDVRGGLTITNNNTATVAVHPRVYA